MVASPGEEEGREIYCPLNRVSLNNIIGEFVLQVDGFKSSGGLWSGVAALGFLVLQLSTLF